MVCNYYKHVKLLISKIINLQKMYWERNANEYIFVGDRYMREAKGITEGYDSNNKWHNLRQHHQKLKSA